MPSLKTILPLIATALAVGFLLLLDWHGSGLDPVSEPVVKSQALDTFQSSPDAIVQVPEPLYPNDHSADPLPPRAVPVEERTMDVLLDEAALSALLPAWMREEGVDFYFEATEVVGEPLTRCRGRYYWDDGSFMEYELTDIGPVPKPELIKSLGFNFDQGNTVSGSGYTTAYELEQGTLMNHEYSEVAGEGSLQMLVNDRFLLEVQLEGFAAEAFDDLIKNHLPLDTLLEF